MIKKKRIIEPAPLELAEAIEKLKDYPKSVRLANDLFNVGISLLKENGLYLPFVHYRAELGYVPTDNSGATLLTYNRDSNIYGADKIQAIILSPQKNIGVEISRGRCLRTMLKRSPCLVGIHKVGANGSLGGFEQYNL